MNKYLILLFFVVSKFVLQYLLIDPVYDLHRDEYLHLDQANHLAAGFQSVPPFTSWVAWLIKGLGNGFFWVKFFPALFGALTLVVLWKTVETLKGGLYAQILCAIALTFSAVLRINTLFQPNSADVLFWTLCYYFLIKFIHTQQRKNLIYLGIAFGIGFLNKYNIAFWLLGLMPALLLTEHRKVFLNKYAYLSVLTALIIITPNLIWQYYNNFPVVHHMKELAATQLVNVKTSDYLKDQILFFISSIFVLIAALYAFFKYIPFKKYRIIGWSFLFTTLLFVYFKAKSYYAIGLYPVLLAFGSVYLEAILSIGWKKQFRLVLPVLTIAIFLPILKIGFPILKPEEIERQSRNFEKLGLLRWEDGKNHPLPQDFADMLGWKELAAKVDKSYMAINDPQHTLILCDNYGQSGAINYYSKIKNPQAVSLSADYMNWFPFENQIKHVILVQDASDDDKKRERKKRFFSRLNWWTAFQICWRVNMTHGFMY